MDVNKAGKDPKKQVAFLAQQMSEMRQRPSKEDSAINQQSAARLFPNSILQTSDIRVVKERIEQLIEDMTKTGKKNFEDVDFPPSNP